MSRKDKPSWRAGRPLSEEDEALWRDYTKAVRELKQRPVKDAAPLRPPATPPPAVPRSSDAGTLKTATALPPRPSLQRPAPAPVIEQRLIRRVQRGHHDIDATIDLHGLTQAEAEPRLTAFLRQAQARNFRMVLVITGKGGRRGTHDNPYVARSDGGVLQRAVRLWLQRPQMQSLIVGYADAHQRHGGGGALYVQIRRAERAFRE